MDTLPTRSQEKDYSVQMELTVEMNLDRTTIARTGYTSLDVLSDIGGIQSILVSAMGIFLGIWNYRHFDNYMTSRLFRVQRRSGTSSDMNADASGKVRLVHLLNFYEWLYDLVPGCMRCKRCRKT